MPEPASGDEERPIITIEGESVALGPVRRDLLPLYQKWDNDIEVHLSLGDVTPTSREATEGGYERMSRRESSSATFTIYVRDGWRPIGTANLHAISYRHLSAGFGIAIGEKDFWGKGYGTETTRLMLDYGLTMLGLHRVELSVYASNERGIRAYSRAGFRECGRSREAYRLGGRAYDIVHMDCLDSEFSSPVLHRLMPG